MKCDNLEPKEQTIARFPASLEQKIANIVQLQQYWTLNNVIKLSIKVADQLKRGKEISREYSKRCPGMVILQLGYFQD